MATTLSTHSRLGRSDTTLRTGAGPMTLPATLIVVVVSNSGGRFLP